MSSSLCGQCTTNAKSGLCKCGILRVQRAVSAVELQHADVGCDMTATLLKLAVVTGHQSSAVYRQVLFFKKRAEEELQRSGIDYTIVRPGMLLRFGLLACLFFEHIVNAMAVLQDAAKMHMHVHAR